MENDAIQHHAYMIRLLYSAILALFALSTSGQHKKETSLYFNQIKAIVNSEQMGINLLYRLDTLKSRGITSGGDVDDYFNRTIEFNFKHRRIIVSLKFANYQVDLLCRNDTIFLASVTASDSSLEHSITNDVAIQGFLKKRNKLYSSIKTSRQLIKEISFSEEFAFYCGDGMPKTQKGKYIEHLVNDENVTSLSDMLRSFNCETQAYGVAGLEMLRKKEYKISSDIEKLIRHIKNRNTELIVCSGCLSGLVQKIYSKK